MTVQGKVGSSVERGIDSLDLVQNGQEWTQSKIPRVQKSDVLRMCRAKSSTEAPPS
jgi:hypothetical protein